MGHFTRHIRTCLVAGALLVAAGLSSAFAESLFEKLVMPGALIEGHAKLETSCKNCHDDFSKTAQTPLCLGCHKEIAADRSASSGFHGRNSAARSQDCKACHTDHKGRSADIVLLDPETFRHDLTDFKLTGPHAAMACAGCHSNGKKRREAPSQCVGCHKAKDPHQGRLGAACDGCHTALSWQPPKPFDHATTKFPLVGAHKPLACTTCHVNEQWKGVGRACVDCHRLDDKHQGRNGPKCESCHSVDKWSTVKFNHDTGTKFPLKDAHAKVACTSCHGNDVHAPVERTCVGCHKKDDPHSGALGSQCQQCHNEASFRKKTDFDHDLSRFPLIGLHAAVPCEGCHTTQDYKKTPTTCAACHQDTHHQGRLGTQCANCHNPNGWTLWRFDHGTQTAFPLTGAHTGLACSACHSPGAASLKISTECIACHASDDTHRGAFGRACGTCHSTSTFAAKIERK